MTKKLIKQATVWESRTLKEWSSNTSWKRPLNIFIQELQKVLEKYPEAVISGWSDQDSGLDIVVDREETDGEYAVRLAEEASREAYKVKCEEERTQREYSEYLKLKAKFEKLC
jgi:hypothetical protein